MAASSHSVKPLHVEIHDENVVLQLPDVLAMKCVESRLAVLFKSSDCISVALHSVLKDGLMLSEPRIHHLYMYKKSKPTSVVPMSQITIITPASFCQKSLNQCGHSSGIITISDELFNVLFGFELNLSRCPILLLQGVDGLVLWLPMKSVIGTAPVVKVLCSLEDSLVHVLSFSSAQSSGAVPSSYLVLLGHHGHVLVISLSSGAAVPSYQHHNILGPVQCCMFLDNSDLLYSTDNELYIASLVESVQGAQSGSIKSSAVGISGVSALSALSSSRKHNRTTLGKFTIL